MQIVETRNERELYGKESKLKDLLAAYWQAPTKGNSINARDFK